ncbi:MAG: hypothetical protein AAF449_05805 [Myxococcota bacterium]
MILALIMVVSGPAEAYHDDRRGFALELSSGWRLRPQFGDSEAMVFERRFSHRRGRRSALLSVRGADVELPVLRTELRKVWGEVTGDADILSPLPPGAGVIAAWTFPPQNGRRREVHVYRFGARRFLFTLNAVSRDFSLFRQDTAALLGSFRVVERAAKRRRASASRPSRKRPSPTESSAPNLVGRWVRQDGAALTLYADGRYTLADVEGRYEQVGARLRLTRIDGGILEFRVRVRGDRLELGSSALASVLIFERFRPEQALTGLWVAHLTNGTMMLKLGSDGRFALGAHTGTWSIDGPRLTLIKSKTEIVTYSWEFSAGELTLNGGDLDRPLKFKRR